jgi:ubiquinone biosynthesis protein
MGVVVNLGGWFATLARCALIAAVAATCVVVYSVAALRRLVMRDRVRRAEHRARWRGRTTRWCFARLGGTFIKVGQIMSSRHDLFSPGVIEELRTLQDRVAPFPFRNVRQIIEAELGAPLAQLFREFDEEPVAAGNVAQVHHAVLACGEEVAVKVLRPGIVATVRRDARIMLWLAHLAHMVSRAARTADCVEHVRSLVIGILAQTDLRHERNNYEKFRRNFDGTCGLSFPHVHKQYSTRRVLTMQFIHGTRVDDAHTDHLPNAVQVIRSSFFAMCFDHGFVHADLHPGNLLVTSDGGVVMIDVGLVKRLPRGLLHQIADFTRCLASGGPRDLVEHLSAYHRYLEDTDGTAVELDAAVFIGNLRARPLVELELGVVISELFTLARKHKIRPMPEVTLVLLGMVTNEGMAKRLDPNANVISELARFLGPRVPITAAPRRLARGSREFRPATLAPLRHLAPAPRPLAVPATQPGALSPQPTTGPLPAVPALHHKRARRRSLIELTDRHTQRRRPRST